MHSNHKLDIIIFNIKQKFLLFFNLILDTRYRKQQIITSENVTYSPF